MFGLPGLFDTTTQNSSFNSTSLQLSSSAPYGFSIEEALKELSLEEDGDVNTFLTRSANLLSISSPTATSSVDPYSTSEFDQNALNDINNTILFESNHTSIHEMANNVNNLKNSFEYFVRPPRQSESNEAIGQTWEFILPASTEFDYISHHVIFKHDSNQQHQGKSLPSTPGRSYLQYPTISPIKLSPLRELYQSPSKNTIIESDSNEIFEYESKDLRAWPSLEDFLVTVPEWAICAICSELFDEPMNWPQCNHSFCKSCIERLINFGHRRECPLCRCFMPNEIGIEDLEVNHKIISAISLLPSRCRWGLCPSQTKQHSLKSSIPSSSEPRTSNLTDSLNESHKNSILISRSQNSIQTDEDTRRKANLSCSNSSTSSSLCFDHLQSRNKSISSASSSPFISSLEELMMELPEPKWIQYNGTNSCAGIFPLSSLYSHHLTCKYAPVKCLFKGCSKIVPRYLIEKHQTEKCCFRPTKCDFCSETFQNHCFAAHLESCPQISVQCVCGISMLRKDMPIHEDKECLMKNVKCVHFKSGCEHQCPRKDLESHMSTCPYESVKGFIQRTESRFEDYERTIERLENMIVNLRSQIHQQSMSNSNYYSSYQSNQNLNMQNQHRMSQTRREYFTSRDSRNYNLDPNQQNSRNMKDSSLMGSNIGGAVGHGPRKDRFWDDDNDGMDSDGDFSLYYW